MPESHHIHGPSSLKLKSICPGFTQDQTGDMTAADEGVLMHAAYETGDLSGLPPESAELVRRSLMFVADLERGADEIHKEVRLSIVGGLTWGTADRVIIKGAHGWVVDLKTGWSYIDHPRINRQSHAYVAGVMERYPQLETVEAIFDIPKRDEILRHTWSRAMDYPFLAAVLRSIIGKIENHTDADLYPCEEACGYCARRSGSCPAIANRSMVLAKRYAPLEILDGEEFHSSQIEDPRKMARLMDIARVVEKFAESVKKHAADMARQGVTIPGYSLRERDGVRKITNPVVAAAAVLEIAEAHKIMIDEVDLFGSATFSAKGLEDLITSHCDSLEDKERVLALLNRRLIDEEAVEEGAPIIYLQKNRNAR